MTAAVALLDANVLYPAALRDLLLQLAFDRLFQARWSPEIKAEWSLNLLQNRPDLTPAQIGATQATMHRAISLCQCSLFDAHRRRLGVDDPGAFLAPTGSGRPWTSTVAFAARSCVYLICCVYLIYVLGLPLEVDHDRPDF